MQRLRFIAIIILFISCIGLSQTAYSAFKTGRIGGAKNLVATPVVDLITALNAKLGQVQISQLLSVPGQWLANSDIEDLNLNLESFGGFPLDRHELAFLTHSLATVLSDNTTTLGNSQASLQNLINSSVTNGLCNGSNCSETSADWVHGQVSDENFANADNVNLITASLLDDLMSGDSSHVDGYTSIVLGANSSVGIQDLRDDGFFRSISNPSGNQPPPATEVRNAINYIAGFVQPATVGAPTPAEYTAGQTLVDNFLNNNDRGNFTLANFISCFNNNEAARSGGQGTCNVSASDWDQQVTALANFNNAKSRLAGGTALTIADLQAIPVTFGNLTAPIQEWHADYISSQLGTGDTVSLTDWQNTINGINEGVAARWKIQQVAQNISGHSANDITNHLLLRATDGTFDAATALGAGVSKTAAGFGGSTNISGLTSTSTPAQIQTAVLSYIGFTDPIYAAWNGNSDRANFSLADFTNCFSNNEAQRSGGDGICNVTAADWASNSSELTYFAEAKTLLGTAGTILTETQLSNVGLTLPTSPSPLPLYARKYLSAQLSLRNSAVNTSEWQEVLDYYNDQTASRWFIGAAAGATGSPNYNVSIGMPPSGLAQIASISDIPISSLETSILNTAGMSTNAMTLAGVSLSDLQGDIRTSNLTTSLDGTDIDNWIVSVAGFGTDVSFVNFQSAITNGWTTSNYLAATTVGGWTNSSSDASDFSLCLADTRDSTGGAGNCALTQTAWVNIPDPQTTPVTVTASSEGEAAIGQTISLSASGGDGSGGYLYTVAQGSSCSVNAQGVVSSSISGFCTIEVQRDADNDFEISPVRNIRVAFTNPLTALPDSELTFVDNNGSPSDATGYRMSNFRTDFGVVGLDGTRSVLRFTTSDGSQLQYRIWHNHNANRCSVNQNGVSGSWGWEGDYCRFKVRKVDANGLPTSSWSRDYTVARLAANNNFRIIPGHDHGRSTRSGIIDTNYLRAFAWDTSNNGYCGSGNDDWSWFATISGGVGPYTLRVVNIPKTSDRPGNVNYSYSGGPNYYYDDNGNATANAYEFRINNEDKDDLVGVWRAGVLPYLEVRGVEGYSTRDDPLYSHAWWHWYRIYVTDSRGATTELTSPNGDPVWIYCR